MSRSQPLSRAFAALGALGVAALLAAAPLAIGVDRAAAVDATTTTAPPTPTAVPAAPTTIPVSAKLYAFTPSKLTIASGEPVTILLKSKDTIHDFVVNGRGVSNKKIVTVKPRKSAKGKLVLPKPGKYEFYCSIQGHRAAGMRGTITAT